MMATLYGGNRRGHMTANGLAAQFYGFGYSLAPDASGYVSYWSDDYVYHQSATGSNTILPGYLEGPVEVAALDPQIDENSFTNGNSFCPYISFADMKASEKERIVSAVRTSDGSGYYVDIFYPGVKESDYWMHTVGTAVEVTDRNGIPIPSAPLDSLVPSRQKGYGFLKNIRISVPSYLLKGIILTLCLF